MAWHIKSDEREKSKPRILSAKLSFIFDREIKSFTDKQRLREFSITKLALQQMIKRNFSRQGLGGVRGERKEKEKDHN